MIYSIKLRIFNIKTISKFIILVILFIGVINIHYYFRFSLNLIQPVKYLVPDSYNKYNNTVSIQTKCNQELTKTDFLAKVRNGKKIEKLEPVDISKLSGKKGSNITSVIKKNRKRKRKKNKTKGIGYSKPIYVCYPFNNNIYVEFLNKIFNWIDNSIYSFIPSIVMVACSIAIIYYIRKNSHSLTNQSSAINQQAETNRRKRNNQLSIMLISTNVSFMIFTLPYSILNNENFKKNYEISFFANMMSYSNNSFNFVFYCLFSTAYRNAFKEILNTILVLKIYIINCRKNLIMRKK